MTTTNVDGSLGLGRRQRRVGEGEDDDTGERDIGEWFSGEWDETSTKIEETEVHAYKQKRNMQSMKTCKRGGEEEEREYKQLTTTRNRSSG